MEGGSASLEHLASATEPRCQDARVPARLCLPAPCKGTDSQAVAPSSRSLPQPPPRALFNSVYSGSPGPEWGLPGPRGLSLSTLPFGWWCSASAPLYPAAPGPGPQPPAVAGSPAVASMLQDPRSPCCRADYCAHCPHPALSPFCHSQASPTPTPFPAIIVALSIKHKHLTLDYFEIP